MTPMKPCTAPLQELAPFRLAFSLMNSEISVNFLMSDNCSVTPDSRLLSFLVETLFVRVISLVKVISASATFEWEAAWRAIKKERELKEFFDRLARRTGKKRAIVAVARKLIGRLRAAFKTRKPYQMNPLSLQPA